MATELLLKFILKLQDPVPQYVLGCLPAIATIGAAPENGLMRKALWMLRCLGCPFTGLFYFCNVGNDEAAMSIYWLSSENFRDIIEDEETFRDVTENEDTFTLEKENTETLENIIIENKGAEKPSLKNKPILYRPFGYHAMELLLTQDQKERMKECMAEASILDRFSSVASAYYILVGIFVGIVKANGICFSEDWPYIPLTLAWTLPAIYGRVSGGKVVFKDPRQILGDSRITVKSLGENSYPVIAYTILTALASIVIPWIAVVVAYFTKPIGFYCRSKFLTILCSIWTFNSIVACISHVKGEKSMYGNKFIYCLSCISGAIIAVLLFFLGLLSNENTWWVKLFGETCELSNACI